ncbi:MAG: hypothetical protein H6597_00870 [Flavobacteriales bacterium]|nr:hypothetical protein [Flavobacteriales bacterium]
MVEHGDRRRNSAADAGTDAMTTVCDQGAAIDLFLELGGTPDGGGAWTDPNGNAHTNTFDPSSDPAGIYTYTLAGQAPCPVVRYGDRRCETARRTRAPMR